MRRTADGGPPVLDHAFIAEHTHGFDAFVAVAARGSTGPNSSAARG